MKNTLMPAIWHWSISYLDAKWHEIAESERQTILHKDNDKLFRDAVLFYTMPPARPPAKDFSILESLWEKAASDPAAQQGMLHAGESGEINEPLRVALTKESEALAGWILDKANPETKMALISGGDYISFKIAISKGQVAMVGLLLGSVPSEARQEIIRKNINTVRMAASKGYDRMLSCIWEYADTETQKLLQDAVTSELRRMKKFGGREDTETEHIASWAYLHSPLPQVSSAANVGVVEPPSVVTAARGAV